MKTRKLVKKIAARIDHFDGQGYVHWKIGNDSKGQGIDKSIVDRDRGMLGTGAVNDSEVSSEGAATVTDHRDVGDREEAIAKLELDTLHDRNLFREGWEAARRTKSDHDFKNFHRLMCERFGYVHDERDWKRDQLSLIEWIDRLNAEWMAKCEELRKITHELRTYNPAADEYKGANIHKGWARRIDAAMAKKEGA